MTDHDAPPELEGSRYLLWVEGRRVVHPWDDEGRVHADRLSYAAAALGLHVFRQPIAEDSDPNVATKRRAWTHRRVGSDDVLGLIAKLPGIKFDDLVTKLYHQDPWSEEQRVAAKGKARVALHRLRQRGLVVKVFGEDGVERWQVPGVQLHLEAGDLQTETIPRHQQIAGQPPVLVADQLLAGAAVLRRVGVYPTHALLSDPHLYEDLARAVWSAMAAGASPTTSDEGALR